MCHIMYCLFFFFFQAEDGIRDHCVTGVQTCALPIGVQYRRLPLVGLEELEGAGVYYAATELEARRVRGRDALIIGGGNSAGQAAMFLSRHASHVHLLVRGQSLAASMSSYLSERLRQDPAITIHYGHEATVLHGEGSEGAERLAAVDVRSTATGETTRMPAGGLFIMVGAAPNTGWLADAVALDARGYVKTGREVGGRSTYETSLAGVFAVGDVRSGSTKRVASGVGEGSVVISGVWNHVRGGETA